MLSALREFSMSDLTRTPSVVLRFARTTGAVLTRHGKKEYVILSVQEYTHLLARRDDRQQGNAIGSFRGLMQNPDPDTGEPG